MTDDAQRRAPAARAGEHTPADLLTTVPTYSELALGYPTLGSPSADMAAWARTLDLAGVPDGVRCAIEALTDDGHVLQIVAVAQACELASVDRALPVESRETMTEWRDRARLVAAIAGHRQCALAAMHTLDVDAGATEDPVQRRQVLCTRAEASHIVRQVELGTYDAANAWRPENRLLSRQMAWVDLVDEATIVTATAPRVEPEFDACFDGLDDNVVSGLPPVTHAAALQLQRTLDVPGVSEALVGGGGVVLLDVPDALTLAVLKDTADAKRGVPFGVEMLVEDAPAKHHEAAKRERQYVACLRREQPVLALSPDAGTCLPAVALRAADHRLTLSPICGADVAAVIRGTTGQAVSDADRARLEGLAFSAADVAAAVRPGRDPARCVEHIVRLVTPTPASGRGRDLTLDQLHGAREAVEWGRGLIADLAAWRSGEHWATVRNGAILGGLPGTGKTLFAQALANSSGLPLIISSLMEWQGTGEAHLGTTLRAMRETFARAKALASGRRGCLLLVDEVDVFVDRRTVQHRHADYVLQVINSFLEQLDGAAGREGVIVIGTTNDPDRIDPAIRRPGRLGKTIQMGLPDVEERVAMLRVRLGDDLRDADLLPVAYRTERHTGAMIEALVEDARRRARHAGRPLALDDLLDVAGAGDADTPEATLYRLAVHESGHALQAHLSDPDRDLIVTLQSREGVGGWVELVGADSGVWTRAEAEARIRIGLAGRAAEEIILDSASSGARQDLLTVTRIAVRMLGEWGLGERSLIAVERDPVTALATDPRLQAETSALLDRLYAETRDTVRRHAGAVRRIAEALLVERRLDGARVARLVAEAGPARRR
ncbi:ATP-dependent zinc metalloprotease FtsH 3 [Methylobacterium radiotolerans]|nr:ATP-dependent zinc metalloprotease FtsH 3 [Methylobacterium radiotolerans]